MSKDRLLSDDGLRAEIANILLLDRQTMEPYVSVVDDLINLVNTQKRLYAESVIGEDESAADYSYLPPTLDEMTKSAHEKAVRNKLRAEQRARVK